MPRCGAHDNVVCKTTEEAMMLHGHVWTSIWHSSSSKRSKKSAFRILSYNCIHFCPAHTATTKTFLSFHLSSGTYASPVLSTLSVSRSYRSHSCTWASTGRNLIHMHLPEDYGVMFTSTLRRKLKSPPSFMFWLDQWRWSVTISFYRRFFGISLVFVVVYRFLDGGVRRQIG